MVSSDVFLGGTAVNANTDPNTFTISGGNVGRHVRGAGGADIFTLTGGMIGGSVMGENGDDTITLNGTAITGDILGLNGTDTINLISGSVRSVDWGPGDESGTLDLTNVTVSRDLIFGSGADDFTLTAGTVGRNVRLGPGSGASSDTDTFLMTGGAIGGSVLGDAGEDTITLNGTAITGDICSGSGTDTINLISGSVRSVDWGPGDESGTLDLTNVTVSQDLIFGSGADDFTLTAGTVGRHVWLGRTNSASTEADTFTMTGGAIGGSVVGDAGEDTITLDGGLIASSVIAQGGDDTIMLNGTAVTGDINGNAGADMIEVHGGSVGGRLIGNIGADNITITSGTIAGNVHLGNTFNSSTDEDTLLMTGGTVSGTVLGDRGTDTITLGGGSVALDVNAGWGDDTITLDGATVGGEVLGGLGDDVFTWSSGTMAGFDGGDGSDVALVTASEYDGSQPLDGGDDVGTGDGFIDALTLDGLSLTVGTGNISNWEAVTVLAGTIDFGPTLEVGSGPGLGLIAGTDGIITSTGDFSLTGDLVTEAGGAFQARSGTAATIDITGSVSNAGEMNFQDGAVGDIITVGGDYGGGGALWLDADATGDSADVLTISGDVVAGPTTIFVADISTGGASRNDILLVDVVGATAPGDFVLADGEVDLGGTAYELNLVGTQWVLQAAFLPANLFYEVYPEHLRDTNELLNHRRRFLGRTWLDEDNPPCDRDDRRAEDLTECRGRGAWMAVRGRVADFSLDRSSSQAEAGISGFAYDTRRVRFELGYETPRAERNTGHWVGSAWLFHGSSSLKGSAADASGSINSTSRGLGASLTWYENSNLYVDAQIQVADFDSDVAVDGAAEVSGNGATSYAASLEIGKPFTLRPDLTLTPELQYLHYDVDFNEFISDGGEVVRLEDGTTNELRLGGALEYRATGGDDAVDRHYYISADVFHRLDGTTRVNSDGDTLVSAVAPWRGEVGIGTSREWLGETGARSALFAEIAAGSTFGPGRGTGTTLRGSLGYEIEF